MANIGATELNALRAEIINSGEVLDFENRIPVATQDNLKDMGQALFSYKPALNAFINTLFNKIGLTYIRMVSYSNQLASLKRGMLEFGDTIEEVFTDICKAHEYTNTPPTGDESDVFKVEKPKTLSAFHKINRKNYYQTSINERELQQAFTSYGNFSRYISGIFNSLATSDQTDEYIIMKQLVGDCLKNAYRVVVGKPTDRATSETFSVELRKAGLALQYPSRKYNQAGVMNTTSVNDQIVFLRADIVPVIDVTQLANNFNMNLGKPLSNRIIIVDDFGDTNDAILGGVADRDFTMVYDVLYTTESIYNPKHRYWNYFMHRQQVISSSPFANVICFATEADTFVINSVKVLPEEQNVLKGYSTNVNVEIDYKGTGDLTYVLSMTGNKSANSKVTQDGQVFVGADETAKTLTITATTNAKFGDSNTVAVTGTGTINVK